MNLKYIEGLGNQHQTEAHKGALPKGRNSPQRAPLGLYAEKFSATAFTAPRAQNYRSWFYRIQPSVVRVGFRPLEGINLQTAPFSSVPLYPDPLRWSPFEIGSAPKDFLDGLFTLAACGDAAAQQGAGIHLYCANKSMGTRYFQNSDGELLIVPQTGKLVIHTECGILEVEPGWIAVIPRGIAFRVDLPDGPARGYVCENYGMAFQLPELGPIGSDGLANPRDFEIPVAAYEDQSGEFELVCKLGGEFFVTDLSHSPLDVVAWHGRVYPYRYELNRFNVIGSISYDHPDPSIFTVLTSPSDSPGWASLDFVIFPPRWLVMEDTFRPPWYHRNIMSEFMGLVKGVYDAKPGGGFDPGGSSLHHCMVPHGPDREAYRNAASAELEPFPPQDTMAFMFESRYLIKPTDFALHAPERQKDYADVWLNLDRNFATLR